MAYIKTIWQSEEGTLLNRFTKTNETATTVELTRNPESITQAGTPFSVSAMNNIEDEIEGIANNSYTFSGVKFFNSRVVLGGVDNGTDLLQVGSDTDISASIGRTRIGSNSNYINEAMFGHIDHFNINDIGFRQNSVGVSIVSFPTGGQALIREAGSNVASFSGSSITMSKNTNIESSSIGSWISDSNNARIGHKDYNLPVGYGYLQTNTGSVFVSAVLNGIISLSPGAESAVVIGKTTTDGTNLLQVNGSIAIGGGSGSVSVRGYNYSSTTTSGTVYTAMNSIIGGSLGDSIGCMGFYGLGDSDIVSIERGPFGGQITFLDNAGTAVLTCVSGSSTQIGGNLRFITIPS